ncbi:MAG TPA: BrnA antitoxin family protein [Telluria sp.]|nr:BrnA antitoxin family protein [Telluria sp.]
MSIEQTFAPAYATAPARTARPVKRKTRITIYLDDEVLAQFRSESQQCGKGYQTLINAALRHRLAAQRAEAATAD